MTTDRVDRFASDIAAGPEALARLVDAWQTPGLGGRTRIAFTGLGSSRYAALIVASSLRAAGVSAWVEYASSSAPTAPAEDLVLVAVSASGRTPEVVDAAERHRDRSLVVGITNDPDAPLAGAADLLVPLLAGEETSGLACRTFRGTVAALAMLTGAARRDDLRPTVDALAARLAARGTWLPPLADALDSAPSIDVLADASLVGLAEQAALMLREAPRLPAHANDTGDWLHTGVYLALPGHRALLFPGSAADAEVIDTVRRRGGETAVVAPQRGGDPIRRALVESVVAESLAAELWRRAGRAS
jgi:fructoselysine-6-P-deglycase FrlB-like protein